jgi:hypothetical protein
LGSSTAKRVILYRFDRLPADAFLNPLEYLQADHVELITVSGSFERIPYAEIKALCFGTEQTAADLFRRDNVFDRRPKMPGLWTRFTFRDADFLEGVLPRNLNDWPVQGFLLVPPKAGVERQRVFIPRTAIVGTDLMGVIGAASSKSAPSRSTKHPSRTQIGMFD